MIDDILTIGKTIYLSKTEEYWDMPFTMKRHHTPQTRTTILRAVITEIKNNEFKAKLTNNNNFEKDDQEFVFHKNDLIQNQNFIDNKQLGQWK